MKNFNTTHRVQTALQHEPRANFDELYLLLCVYEQHGLVLTPAQKALLPDLPNPKSVLRIADREKKRCRAEKKS